MSMDDTARHKPNPEPLLPALEKLQVAPQHAVYVGDSRHDMQAGRAAGARTVAALWGPVPRNEVELENPDALARTPNALLAILQAKQLAVPRRRLPRRVQRIGLVIGVIVDQRGAARPEFPPCDAKVGRIPQKTSFALLRRADLV